MATAITSMLSAPLARHVQAADIARARKYIWVLFALTRPRDPVAADDILQSYHGFRSWDPVAFDAIMVRAGVPSRQRKRALVSVACPRSTFLRRKLVQDLEAAGHTIYAANVARRNSGDDLKKIAIQFAYRDGNGRSTAEERTVLSTLLAFAESIEDGERMQRFVDRERARGAARRP